MISQYPYTICKVGKIADWHKGPRVRAIEMPLLKNSLMFAFVCLFSFSRANFCACEMVVGNFHYEVLENNQTIEMCLQL